MLVGFATSTIHFYLALLLTFLWYSKKRWETIRTRKWNYPSFRTSGDGTSHMDPNDKSYSRHCWCHAFQFAWLPWFYWLPTDMFFRWPVRRFRTRESRHSFSVENGKKPLRSTRMNSVSTLAFFKPSLYEFVLRFFFSNPWKILEDPWICGKLKWSHFPTQCTNLAGRCFSRCGLNAFHGGAGGTRRGHPLSWQVLPSKLMCTWWCLMM